MVGLLSISVDNKRSIFLAYNKNIYDKYKIDKRNIR